MTLKLVVRDDQDKLSIGPLAGHKPTYWTKQGFPVLVDPSLYEQDLSFVDPTSGMVCVDMRGNVFSCVHDQLVALGWRLSDVEASKRIYDGLVAIGAQLDEMPAKLLEVLDARVADASRKHEVDDAISLWHTTVGEGSQDLSLCQHLGWTWEEYKAFTERGELPPKRDGVT